MNFSFLSTCVFSLKKGWVERCNDIKTECQDALVWEFMNAHIKTQERPVEVLTWQKCRFLQTSVILRPCVAERSSAVGDS